MPLNLKAPVIIGGVGGSGTRAVVAILQNAGVYMGSYNNGANDNLHFARLISDHPEKRKRLYVDLKLSLNTFHRLYFGQTLVPRQIACIYTCARQPRLKQTWLLIRRSHDVKTQIHPFHHWGFKTPGTCLFLPQLNKHYPECTYIHVIRHGLDMAFSSNIEPLKRWGREFGIDSKGEHFTVSDQINFWIAVNKYVLDQCQSLFAGRHYILNFDRLCESPEQEIGKLLDFLGITSHVSIEEISKLVTQPGSTGRYRAHLSEFTAEQIQAVRNFGFDVG